VTQLVNALGKSGRPWDDAAFARLYDELRRLASRMLGRERDRGVYDTTALVHEAFLKLGQFEGKGEWESRAHFFGAAARAMRQILVNQAKEMQVQGRVLRILADAGERSSREVTVLDLDEALSALNAFDADLHEIMLLRVFAGLPVAEVSELVERSESSIKRDWQVARAWLLRWLIDHGRADGRSER
jgi:RNA polymerase sigma factor (TIGR02999 family)